MTRNTMRKKLLLGTVALMTGVGLASAQGMRDGSGTAGGGAVEQHGTPSGSPAAKSQGGAETRSEGQAETRSQGGAEQKTRRDHSEQKAQKSQPDKNSSSQTKPDRSTTGQGSSEKDEPKTKSSGKENLNSKEPRSSQKQELNAQGSAKDSAKDSAKTGGESTAGQSTSDKNAKGAAGNNGAADNKAQTQEKPAASQDGSATQNQNASQTQTGAGVQSQAGVKVTPQQQTTIQKSVLSAKNAPHIDRVNFDIHTGAVVPTSVRIAAISTFPILIETFPQYRDYSFFVVEDEIVFVDRGHKVVDVVPVGPRARFARASSGGSSGAVAVNLSEPEIREVQQVLITRGFLHGRVTGVWGPETQDALIAFQRKEGFAVTGNIDTRTVTSLGLSGKVKAQESTSSSNSTSPSGQSQTGGQQQAPTQNTTEQSPSAQNRSTAGQDRSETQKPSDKQSTGPSQSTTGQGNSSSNTPSKGSSMNNSGSPSSTSGSSGQNNAAEKNK